MARAIKPKKASIDPKRQLKAITNGLDVAAKGIKKDLELPTKTWSHSAPADIQGTGFVRQITVSDEVYAMLNEGTDPHPIRAKRSKVLAFNTPFRSKTVPRSLTSGPGSIGSTTVLRREVQHPGTEPREWDATVAEDWNGGKAAMLMQAAIDGAIT
jgi:hypothetical protein